MSTLQVKIGSSTKEGKDWFTATVSLPNAKPTKLQRKDGSVLFGTRAAALSASRNFGKSVSMDVEVVEKSEKTTRKAAKRNSSRKSRSAATTTTPTS